MTNTRPNHDRRPIAPRRRGSSLAYATLGTACMCAIISLGVDFGRVQLAKTQLQASTDAAARYAAAGLRNALDGTNAAPAMARVSLGDNTVDGRPIDLRDATVELGTWKESNGKFKTSTNMAKVDAVRVKVNGDYHQIPLLWGALLGRPVQRITATSVAYADIDGAKYNGRFRYWVPATSNPWLAGMGSGTIANPGNPHSNPDYAGTEFVDKGDGKMADAGRYQGTDANRDADGDGNEYEDVGKDGSSYNHAAQYYAKKASPIRAGTLEVTPGESLTFDGINGGADHQVTDVRYDGDGKVSHIAHNQEGAEHGKSDVRAPINSIIAVFLSDTVSPTAPETLDFSTAASRDFMELRPKLQQVFFIGDGRRSSGEVQRFVVPPGATRLYIGAMDEYEWNNNVGGFEVTAVQSATIRLVK